MAGENCLKVMRPTCENHHHVALGVQEQINEIITITLRFPLFPALKTMLGWTGIDCGPCLAPRRARLSKAEET